jgi:antitoxin component YwqK of YwqJK toxin-antitoxin module
VSQNIGSVSNIIFLAKKDRGKMLKLYFIFFIFFFTSCGKIEKYYYANGNMKMKFVKKNNRTIKAYSWYQNGKKESKSKIISVDTSMVYEPTLNDSIAFIEIKQKNIMWYENGKIKEKEFPQSDGTRRIDFFDENGTKVRTEIYRLNRKIKEE